MKGLVLWLLLVMSVAAEPILTPQQFQEQLDQRPLLLDVRTPAELKEHGMIEGSLCIPIDQLEARLDEIPKDRPVLPL